ncbi:MAG: Ada metal-binding domain-containing protein, partial [Planctomycetota bacterium]
MSEFGQQGRRTASTVPFVKPLAEEPAPLDSLPSRQSLESDDECFAALAARDARFDGQFFVGVSTTGIYC